MSKHAWAILVAIMIAALIASAAIGASPPVSQSGVAHPVPAYTTTGTIVISEDHVTRAIAVKLGPAGFATRATS